MPDLEIRIRFRDLLYAVLLVVVLVASFQLSSIAAPVPLAAPSDEGLWVLQTRENLAAGQRWEAYLLNTATGEIFFVKQDVKTPVQQEKGKDPS